MTSVCLALRVALLLTATVPGIAASASTTTAAAKVVHKAEVPATPVTEEVPGIVLLGMAVSGLLIVGIASRRRSSGRSVSS